PPTQAEVFGRWVQYEEITIGPNGNVYFCNSGKQFQHATLAIGNIYEESLDHIVNNNHNPLVRILRKKGVRGLANCLKRRIPMRKYWHLYDKFGPCGLCHNLLRNHGKEIMERIK
ncbi:MAG: SPASM domain-containing protein, partial [Candidatus Aenigmatarchaeota archaeon]